MKSWFCVFALLSLLLPGCNQQTAVESQKPTRIPVILDSDANNELDDQHAMAYLLLNQNHFDVKGITVNATYNGGNIDAQYEEADRVLKLLDEEEIPLFKGANANFDSIDLETDGKPAIDFITKTANKYSQTDRLVLITVGKLTNIALALRESPEIRNKVRIVWLGSNYPDPGEYNLKNDTIALNYILKVNVPFEIVTVGGGKPSGSNAVRVTPAEIEEKMPGKGPEVPPVVGRHGNTFSNFGDYSVDLFSNVEYLYGNPPGRALFDVVAVAVVKDPTLGEANEIAAPNYINGSWVEIPGNSRKIIVWKNFDKEQILGDFFESFE